jgi:hypothetical protein
VKERTKQRDDARKNLNSVSQSLEKERGKAIELETNLTQVLEEKLYLEEQLQVMINERAAVKDLEALEGKMASPDAELANVTEKYEERISELATTREELAASQKQLVELGTERAALLEEIRVLKESNEETQEKLKDAEVRVSKGMSLRSKLFSRVSDSTPSSTGWDSFKSRSMTNIPSGEEQRKFRRTIYTHDDWKKHRSQDRFLYYLAAIFKSGVYKNLANEVMITTGVAVFVCACNAILPNLGLPNLGLPLSAFTLTSPSLGLLLGTLFLSRVVSRISSNFHIFLFSRNVRCYHNSLSYQHLLPTLGRGT